MRTHAAMQRIADLTPEFCAAFCSRKMAIKRLGPNERAPRDLTTFEEIERWFYDRGVVCRIAMPAPGLIDFDEAVLRA